MQTVFSRNHVLTSVSRVSNRVSALNCQCGPDGEREWDEAVVWEGEQKGRDEVER